MLTKMFHQILRSTVTGESFTIKNPNGVTSTQPLPTQPSNGKQGYYTKSMLRIPYIMACDSYSETIVNQTGGVCFGTGTAVPTENDYTITQKILDAASGVAVAANVTQNGSTFVGTYSLINNGSSSLTISEIGLFGTVLKSESSYTHYLIDRTLLDEPLTISPGEAGKVIYTIAIA